jgi:hypothetical protein
MKNIYQIKAVKNGVETVHHREIQGDLDELHIVSMRVIRQDLIKHVEAIHRANSFREKYLPAFVFFGSLALMALVVLNNRGFI